MARARSPFGREGRRRFILFVAASPLFVEQREEIALLRREVRMPAIDNPHHTAVRPVVHHLMLEGIVEEKALVPSPNPPFVARPDPGPFCFMDGQVIAKLQVAGTTMRFAARAGGEDPEVDPATNAIGQRALLSDRPGDRAPRDIRRDVLCGPDQRKCAPRPATDQGFGRALHLHIDHAVELLPDRLHVPLQQRGRRIRRPERRCGEMGGVE